MTTLARISAALLFVLALSFADQYGAQARPASKGCENTWGGGCINVDRDGRGPLYVHSAQPGVWSGSGTEDRYGQFRVRLTRKSNGIPTIIRTSTPRWVHITNLVAWGPLYILDKTYADGDVLCGSFTAYHPDDWGCITIHKEPPR